MQYTFKFLKESQIEQIYQCMIEAFSDYEIDLSYMTLERFKNRMTKNAVQYQYSPGAFLKNKLVGFTLVGIDQWDNQLAAFDAITGIVEDHRGKGLSRMMFNYSLEALKSNKVKKFILEVLQTNSPAIKAYERTGFTIQREFNLYKLNFEDHLKKQFNTINLETRLINLEEFNKSISFIDWNPSWENSFSSLNRIPDKTILIGAFINHNLVGSIAYYPGLDWILNISVDKQHRRKGIGNRLIESLFSELHPSQNSFKLNNVITEDMAFNQLLTTNGFHIYGKQYEMHMDLF